MPVIRGLIQAVLVIAFALGAVCAVLSARAQRRYGLVGVLSASLATLAGGSEVAVDGPVAKSNYVGLDWLLLNLLVLGLLFVPMERMFTRIPAQPIVRKGFRTDMVYFAVSHLLVQVSVLLTMAPARVLFGWTEGSALQRAVASQPLPLQFLEAMFLADLFGYASHRAFHAVPFLWRFHHIHHSSEQMDWLAGSRLHIVDILVMRAVGFVPIYALGFSQAATYAYLSFVSFHAVFIHANVRFDLRAIEGLVVTPRFHHFHHSAEVDAVDKNFAVHLPLIDRVFGTLHMPQGRWPARYGVDGPTVPASFLGQLVYPFVRRTDPRTPKPR
jgi:lathosterol oxidase